MFQYIKTHYAHFSIAEYFKSTHIQNQLVAEDDFKRIVEQILQRRIKAAAPVRKWAKKIKANNFEILQCEEAIQFWNTVATRKEVLKAAQAEKEYALKKIQFAAELRQQVLEQAGSTSEPQNSYEQEEDMSKSPSSRCSKRLKTQGAVQYIETEENDSELECPHKVQKYYWLSGEGDMNTEAKTRATEWICGESNVSDTLDKYRRDAVGRAKDVDLDDITDMLAINHIFYFPKNKGKGVWRVLADEHHDAIEVDLGRTAGLQRLPFQAVEKCRNLSMVAQEDESELRTMFLHYQLETKSDKVMMPFIRCVDQLSTNYQNVNDFYDLEEIRFCEQALMPYIQFIFPAKERFTIEGPSRSSKACKKAFEGVDSSVIALKPDVIVSRCQSEYVAGEVKKPDHKYFGVYTDLPKLGFELKYMLDHLITADPCKEVAVTGILLEGFRCTTFKMDLRYDGIYRFVALGEFHLIINTESFLSCIDCYEKIMQLKNIVSQSSSSTNKLQWTKPSFLPPLKRI